MRGRQWGIVIVLMAITLATFGRAVFCGFVDLDDEAYVLLNPHVWKGLSGENAAWAFSNYEGASWMPLTWMTLQLDATISPQKGAAGITGGPGEGPRRALDAGVYHADNLIWHAGAVALLFMLLYRCTGRQWAGALVAALWAVHPLRVESVVWVAERKDVLALFWGLAALNAYLIWRRTGRWAWYAGLCAAFVLSLMGKALFVSLPVLLLIVDFWPLGRWRDFAGVKRAILEKIPLFAIAAAVSFVALAAQGSAVAKLDEIGLGLRLENAWISYARYIGLQFYCWDLGVYYPGRVEAPMLALATVVLAGITALCVWQWRRRPWLLAGWLWFVISLGPVIGVIQIGGQAYADRYTYLPAIGLLVMIVWSIPRRLFEASGRRLLALGSAALILVLAALTVRQIGFWQNSVDLFQHTISVTQGNYYIEADLAHVYLREGQLNLAERHLLEAVQMFPGFARAQAMLGKLYLDERRWGEALPHLKAASELDGADPAIQNMYGVALIQSGHVEEAAQAFANAVRLNPSDRQSQLNLARVQQMLRGRAQWSPNATTSAPGRAP